MSGLSERHCKPCEGGAQPLDAEAARALLGQLQADWALVEDGRAIAREVTFRGFLKAMAFANAVAWVADREGHHPDLALGYGYCRVRYTTHAIGGLSENDFICAAKVDALLEADQG